MIHRFAICCILQSLSLLQLCPFSLPSHLRMMHAPKHKRIDEFWNHRRNDEHPAPEGIDIRPILRNVKISPNEDAIGSMHAQEARGPTSHQHLICANRKRRKKADTPDLQTLPLSINPLQQQHQTPPPSTAKNSTSPSALTAPSSSTPPSSST